MPRVWAQEWKKADGSSLYSIHRYQGDIIQFGKLHNEKQYDRNLLTQHHRAWQTEVSEGDVQKIDDHGYGLFVRRKPR